MTVYEYDISKRFEFSMPQSTRCREVMSLFGITKPKLTEHRLFHQLKIRLEHGQICFITGGSGAGKSVLLNELYQQTQPSRRIRLRDVKLPAHQRLIDTFDVEITQSLQTLAGAGLSDAFCGLQKSAHLSEGQAYRARLAHLLISDAQIIFADEFCSTLDRISAFGVAHRFRRFADKTGKVLILASCHDDIVSELAPDVLVMKKETQPVRVIYKPRKF